MSATDELRRLLDERGVPYVSDVTAAGKYQHTSWRDEDYREVYTVDFGERKLLFRGDLTPAQVIDATLGRGTCHSANVTEYAWDDFECSECGWVTWNFVMEHEGCGTVQQPRYCPNCGRKVKEG